MKEYKNSENELFAFDLDCFDKKGQVINEIVEKMILERSNISIINSSNHRLTSRNGSRTGNTHRNIS